MLKAIFYKEWVKTRWFFLLSLAVSLGFTLFCILRLDRMIALKGAQHFWEVMLQRGVVFVELLEYVPLLIGVLWAVVQFAPEMHNKCLKLTLHLPFSQLKMTMAMLLSGFVLLLACFGLNLALIYFFFSSHFAAELVQAVLLTALPWFMAGLAAYLLFAWICLEPTWKRRVLNTVLSVFLLRIFFLSGTPAAYQGFIAYLMLGILLLFPLSWQSILRFKEGKQD